MREGRQIWHDYVPMKVEYNWARLLAYVTGLVNQELLLQNEYLAAENRILRSHLPSQTAAIQPGARDAGRDWPQIGKEGSGECGLRGETRSDSGWVSPTRGRQ